MKNLRTMAILTAAVVGLVTSLPAQQTDSTRSEGGDRPTPMMEHRGVEQDSGMDAMMPKMDMMRQCRPMMKRDSGTEPDSMASAGDGS